MFDRFAAAARRDPVARRGPAPIAPPPASPSVTGREEDLVAQLARLADLTVVPHPDAGEDVSSSDALHAVLFDSGRPVLIAPQIAPATIGTPDLRRLERHRRIRRGGMRGAALDAAGRGRAHSVGGGISAAWAGRRRSRGLPRAAWCSCRDRHVPHGQQQVGAGLLAAAREFGGDLLAMGAYSHSRLRQLILGGVTRHVLEHATLPVMMSR